MVRHSLGSAPKAPLVKTISPNQSPTTGTKSRVLVKSVCDCKLSGDTHSGGGEVLGLLVFSYF